MLVWDRSPLYQRHRLIRGSVFRKEYCIPDSVGAETRTGWQSTVNVYSPIARDHLPAFPRLGQREEVAKRLAPGRRAGLVGLPRPLLAGRGAIAVGGGLLAEQPPRVRVFVCS